MAVKPKSSLPPTKKQKTKSTTFTSVQTIQDLEKHISFAIENDKSLNALADLLHLASSTEDVEVVLKAIYAISRVLGLVIQKGLLRISVESEERKKVRAWLVERLEKYKELLCGLLQDDEKILRTSSIEILLHLLKYLSIPRDSEASSSSSGSTESSFDVVFFKKIISALVICPQSTRTKSKMSVESDRRLDLDVRDAFAEKWLNPYADVRWYCLRELGNLLSDDALIKSHPQIPYNALSILEALTNMPEEQSDLSAWWVESLGTSSSSKSSKKQKHSSEKGKDAEEDEAAAEDKDDDWRKFFDEPEPSTSKDAAEPKSRRLHTLTIVEQLHTVGAHRAVFTKCWLALLPRLSSMQTRGKNKKKKRNNKEILESWDPDGVLSLLIRALSVFHRGVLPHLTRAVLVMDWVSGCVDHGGVVGMLALNALFVLMKEYNLDYPKFYTRLYSFLDNTVLHVKYRARFFRLCELFLSSTHLPATILASFVKRLARLSLAAPPAAIIMIIPFTYNILKRHPALMSMIHRQYEEGTDMDPFNPDESDPLYTNAIDSSLWELNTHQNHYYSVVSTLAKIFTEPFTKPNYNMEDFLDHTYATLMDTEIKKKIKRDPAIIELDVSASNPVLAEQQDILAEENDIVGQFWTM